MKTTANITDDTILDCGHKPSPHSECTTGYGYDENRKTFCYACAAVKDREWMQANGRITLYLTTGTNGECKVGNWPGSLSFQGRFTVGRHNMAIRRYDVWFTGPDSATWHGVTYGDNTQLCHCRRTKQ